jgi:hypothetical protein
MDRIDADQFFGHGTERTPKPRPFQTRRVGHPEKLNQSLSIDVQGWYHPTVNDCQQKNAKGLATRHLLKLMALGAVSFWLPDILWHVIRGSQFEGRDVIAITVLMPLSLSGTYTLVKRLPRSEEEKTPIFRWMLLGLWLFGGFFIMVEGSFLGAGFATSSDLSDFLQSLAMSFLPGIAYIMAAYDGSLGALLIVSVVPPIIWFVRAKRQSIVKS